jgi:shikimate dehydrogenase
MTSARTKLLALIGSPVAHSRSPAIHTAALEALGIDAVYVACDVAPSELGAAIAGLRALGAAGANVTVPYKERVMEHLDRVDAIATSIGAVNTIVREGDALVGTNTDAEGLARSLAGVDATETLVIGAGGAARAAVIAARSLGAIRVNVAARSIERASAIGADDAFALADLDTVRRAAASSCLLIHATSATLHGDGRELVASLPIDALPPHATVVDLVYTPRITPILERARQRELRTVDGLGMLVHQAAIAFERWFGVEPPIDVMERAADR